MSGPVHVTLAQSAITSGGAWTMISAYFTKGESGKLLTAGSEGGPKDDFKLDDNNRFRNAIVPGS